MKALAHKMPAHETQFASQQQAITIDELHLCSLERSILVSKHNLLTLPLAKILDTLVQISEHNQSTHL